MLPFSTTVKQAIECHNVTMQLITINITWQVGSIFHSILLTDFDVSFVPLSTWKKNWVLFW